MQPNIRWITFDVLDSYMIVCKVVYSDLSCLHWIHWMVYDEVHPDSRSARRTLEHELKYGSKSRPRPREFDVFLGILISCFVGHTPYDLMSKLLAYWASHIPTELLTGKIAARSFDCKDTIYFIPNHLNWIYTIPLNISKHGIWSLKDLLQVRSDLEPPSNKAAMCRAKCGA